MLLLGLWVRILVSFWFVDDLPLCPDTVGTVDPSTGGTTVSVVTKGKGGGSGGGKGNCRGEGSVSLGGPSSIPGRWCCARVGSATVCSGSEKSQLYFVTCYHVQIVLVCTMILTFLFCAVQVMLSSWRFWKLYVFVCIILFFVNKRSM